MTRASTRGSAETSADTKNYIWGQLVVLPGLGGAAVLTGGDLDREAPKGWGRRCSSTTSST
jgi:hypothetical protein